jgi:hypothetical protein
MADNTDEGLAVLHPDRDARPWPNGPAAQPPARLAAKPAAGPRGAGKRVSVYASVQLYCRTRHGFLPQTCWIADVLAEHGLTRRQAPNRKNPARPTKPCPARHRDKIVEAIQSLGLVEPAS